MPPEPLEVAVVSRLVREGDVFIDVGAHWGLYVLHVLGRLGSAGEYFAIEPAKANIAFLETIGAPASAQLRIMPVAAGDRDGSAALVAAYDGDVGAHVVDAALEHETIAICRLDGLLNGDRLGKRQLVVKIDAEGMEVAVIRGCARWRAFGITPIFALEFIPDAFKQTRDEIIGAVRSTFGDDYRFFAIDELKGGLDEFVPPALPEKRIRNILAMPSSCSARLDASLGFGPL